MLSNIDADIGIYSDIGPKVMGSRKSKGKTCARFLLQSSRPSLIYHVSSRLLLFLLPLFFSASFSLLPSASSCDPTSLPLRVFSFEITRKLAGFFFQAATEGLRETLEE